jgi:FkbM family methyltransferase
MPLAKRLALSALIAGYSGCRTVARVCRRAMAGFRKVFSYARGVHLLVLERIAAPPVETVKVVTLAAGGATFKMALVTPGLIEDHILRDRCWEPNLMELMSAFMPSDGVFVDVGANIGWHSLHLAARYPGARCHAFEPHPEIFRQLARNTRLSSLKNLTLNPYAVGRVSREGIFYLQEAGSYNRGLSSAAPQADLKNNWQEAVMRFEPLDDVLSEADRQAVSLIKIDTQGCEQDVLAGARRTIDGARPTVIMEFESRYHPDPEREIRDILALLPEYEIFCLKAGSADLRRFDVHEVRDLRFEADLVCMPT